MKITVVFDSLEEFNQYFSVKPVTEEVPAEKPKRGRPKKTEDPEEAPAAAETPAPVPAEEVPFEEEKPVSKEISLTDVRAIALKLSKSGKQAELKEAFAKFGAKKLSDVPKDQYYALMVELDRTCG